MWKPRLVALDLDGTLVGPGDAIPSVAVAAVRDAAAAGAHVVIATGRGWHSTRHHVDTLGLRHGPHVTSNGAVLVRYPPVRVDELTTFDPGPVIERVLARRPQCIVAVEEVGQGYLVSRPFPEGELGPHFRVVSLERLTSQPATRLVIRDPDASDGEFVTLAADLGMVGVSYSVGTTAWLDIAPAGVNKAAGLASVAAGLGVDAADVLAIGDGRNDIEMLQWAGRGVALAEAPPEVQAIADDVTGPFAEHGTVVELRRWFAAR
nr:HAD family phosphatase [Propionibacterium sp.]